MDQFWDKIGDLSIAYGPLIILAIIALIIGIPLIKLVKKIVDRQLDKKNVDPSIRNFSKGFIGILLNIALFIIIAQTIGIKITSLIALLGAAGLAIGLALKDSLSNFASGFLILYFRPFKVGNLIEVQGALGFVKEIHPFATVLLTTDNKQVIIPNGKMLSDKIINYHGEDTRRADFIFGISYEDDISKAKAVLKEIIETDKRILKTPEYLIAVNDLGDSSVNLVVRVWCKKEEYSNIYFDMQEKVKVTFDERGISIPYPQRVIWQGQAM